MYGIVLCDVHAAISYSRCMWLLLRLLREREPHGGGALHRRDGRDKEEAPLIYLVILVIVGRRRRCRRGHQWTRAEVRRAVLAERLYESGLELRTICGFNGSNSFSMKADHACV